VKIRSSNTARRAMCGCRLLNTELVYLVYVNTATSSVNTTLEDRGDVQRLVETGIISFKVLCMLELVKIHITIQ
jgi:hypothetical protein